MQHVNVNVTVSIKLRDYHAFEDLAIQQGIEVHSLEVVPAPKKEKFSEWAEPSGVYPTEAKYVHPAPLVL